MSTRARFLIAGGDEIAARLADSQRTPAGLVDGQQTALETLWHTVWTCEREWREDDRMAAMARYGARQGRA